jgi:hypothetical protein
MNPLVNEVIARQRMASLQEEADRWRLAHPGPTHQVRHGRIARFFSGAVR